jgi:hypothetical protein
MKKFMFAVALTFALAAGAVGTVTLMTVNPVGEIFFIGHNQNFSELFVIWPFVV